MTTEVRDCTPIIRIEGHTRPIAIISLPFTSRAHGDLRAMVYDFGAREHVEAPLDWIRMHTTPAYRGLIDPESEQGLSDVLTDFYPQPYQAPVFDRGETEPMKSWMESAQQ